MMNNGNEISHQTKLYGFIGEFAGQSSLSATLNKMFKANNKDAMMIPMNIREDDFYFTVANMKKSHVNGAVISSEYVTNVVEILDESTEVVKRSGMCDILLRDGEKLIGDVAFTDMLIDFLKEQGVMKIALIGTNHYAKAFALKCPSSLHVSYFNDDLEALMNFTSEMHIDDADINRIADNMDVDFSSFDAVIDFSELESLSMVNKLSKINLDMKQKKQFSALKARTNELGANYIGFDDMLNELSGGIFEFYKSKNHLDYDKSDMRF
ncbi:hypothetical protein [Sulfurimonas sp.]|uniref:hypothetical protein n=1 Tax=Sulfurimonas sp. TaxID=2022749 RepID=UPI0026050EDC|nr:hypothetical protein [Sulfurimonas sp.]MCW8895303.1 hypothetical protein [Sulfurimonas sp.]